MNSRIFSITTLFLLLFYSTTLAQTPDYSDSWKRIDSLLNKGLTRSALDLVKEIRKQARTDKNPQQGIKAISMQIGLESQVTEKSDSMGIRMLEAEVAAATHPEKQILSSLLATAYQNYYQRNRYQILNRTQLEEATDDFQTWDAKSFQAEIICLFDQSLEEKDQLKQIPVRDFESILNTAEESPEYRPTLFDLLAHRALDYFITRQYGIINPIETFDFELEELMVPASAFLTLEWEKPGKLAREIRTMKLFQELIRMHKDENPNALIDVELKRLNYLRQHIPAEDEEKNAAYFEQLELLSKVAPKEEITAEVFYQMASLKSEIGSKYDPEKGEEYRWEKKEAHEICENTRKIYPSTSRGVQQCENLMMSLSTPNLELTVEQVYLPSQPMLVKLTYKHPSKVYFRLVELNQRLINTYNRNSYRKKLLKESKVLREWTQEMKNEGDFQKHSTEIAVDGLGNGRYALLASYTPGFVLDEDMIQHASFQVSKIAFFLQQEIHEKKQGMFVRDRESGEALAGARVQVYQMSRRNDKLKKAGKAVVADKEGFVEIPFQERYGQTEFVISHKKEMFYSNRMYRYRGRRYGEEQAQTRAHIFTDRKIYRPGQTIYFKCIVMESVGNSHSLKKNHPTKLSFYDVNSQLIKEIELKTNDYGSIQGTFIAPNNGLTGRMTLQTEGGYSELSVEEYKRPKFETKFEPVTGDYRLGEEVEVEGIAKAFAGSNIDGARVVYRVVRSTSFPYWYSGFRRGRYYPPSRPEKEIVNGTTQTNAEGKFTITFIAEPDKKIDKSFQPIFRYKVFADVVDISGETHSAETSIKAAYTSLDLELSAPQIWTRGTEDNMEINSANLNGSPLKTAATLVIYKLKAPEQIFRTRKWKAPDQPLMSEAEFRKKFPYEVYQDEHEPDNWPKTQISNTALNLEGQSDLPISNYLGKAAVGKYLVELIAQDPSGEEIKVQNYLNVAEKSSKVPVTPTVLSSQIDKMKLEPGETAKLHIHTSTKKLWVLYELTQNGKVLERDYMRLRGKKGESIEIPIKEEYRGGISIALYSIFNNEFWIEQRKFSVPWSNKELKLSWSTFRNKLLPGQEEEWRLKIEGPKGEAVAAELVASLYDASLDEFRSNAFHMYLYGSENGYPGWTQEYGFGSAGSYRMSQGTSPRRTYVRPRAYDQLPGIVFQGYRARGDVRYKSASRPSRSVRGRSRLEGELTGEAQAYAAAPVEADMAVAEGLAADSDGLYDMEESRVEMLTQSNEGVEKPEAQNSKGQSEVSIRRNLQETAFFFPQLQTNAEGEVFLKFRVPEALTRWKFIGLAHTQDLKVGTLGGNTITQKDLMVFPNMPRFLREGDSISFTAKISNLGEEALSGNAELRLLDALTMEPVASTFGVEKQEQSFTVEKGQSTVVSWDLKVPTSVQALVTQVVASAGDFSDGEENVLPILKNSMLVTESMPLAIRGNESKTFSFKKLAESGKSETLKHHKVSLEFSSNPAWYAVQSLPYLMEYPHECTEQIFSRFYANALASHIANSTPKIQQIFNQWKLAAQSPDAGALLSNLEKNQELKAVLLEETPWVLNAKSESERKKRIGLLFDLNRMQAEFARANKQLEERQNGNGAFSWFPGMSDSRYITQLIVTGLGYMDHLGVNSGNPEINGMAAKGLKYLDNQIRKDFQNLKKYKRDLKEDNLGRTQIQYLYARSFFPDVPLAPQHVEAYNYYAGQGKKFWLDKSKYMQGMLSLVYHRSGAPNVSGDILKSLKENAVFNEELGMYWKDLQRGWYWYQAPIERHSLLLEAFNEVAKDQEAVEELKIWLLKNKQTNDWKTTRATVAAVNALLSTGSDWLESSELVEIVVGGEVLDPKTRPDVQVEAGTGYFKTSWDAADVKPNMGEVKLSKKDKGIAWGAMYWQYFEQLDKITFASTPLSLKKQLYLKENSPEGPKLVAINENSPLERGDRITVRVELRVDRAMEYVHMKDMRAAAFEPVETISRYHYKAGLGYYQSTRDVATHFFFEYLPKGTHVFEYDLLATQTGDFSNGITSIQCMYAPEFTSHSEGIRVQIK